MVLPTSLSTFFARGPVTNAPNRPMYNDIPYTVSGSNSLLGGPQLTYQTFWKRFKNSPELVSVISIPITDIIGDRPAWVGIDGAPLGRNKLMEAKKFWRDNNMKQTTKSWLYDTFVTGDGYLWSGRLSDEDRMKKVKEVCDTYSKFVTKEDYAKMFIKATQDEELKATKRVDYLASSTVNIEHTDMDILSYVQNVNGRTSEFMPQEIVHMKYMDVDGKINGFSPMESLAAEAYFLSLVKENMIAYLRNGGSPSKMFVLPDEMATSENHQFLVETLQRYNSVQNRNGNLVFTGNVDVKDLAAAPKDMEYQTLALYTTSNIALGYRIPVSRIPYLIGKSATSGDSGGLSEAGYWNMISEYQDYVEDLLNSQIFEEKGYHIILNRKYKQDEIREAQTASMNAQTINTMLTTLGSLGQTIKKSSISRLFENPKTLMPSDLEERKMDETVMSANQGLLDDMSMSKEPDAMKRANTKREAEQSSTNNKDNKGLSV